MKDRLLSEERHLMEAALLADEVLLGEPGDGGGQVRAGHRDRALQPHLLPLQKQPRGVQLGGRRVCSGRGVLYTCKRECVCVCCCCLCMPVRVSTLLPSSGGGGAVCQNVSDES